MEALFWLFTAMGLLFTGAGLLIALVEGVLWPIWKRWKEPDSCEDDSSQEGGY